MTVAVRDDPAEVGVSLTVLDQKQGPPAFGGQLTAHNGPDTGLFGGLEKK